MSLGQEAERVESATGGSLTVTTIAMPPKNSSTPPISSTIPMRHDTDRVDMALERGEGLAGFEVPDAQGVVQRAG